MELNSIFYRKSFLPDVTKFKKIKTYEKNREGTAQQMPMSDTKYDKEYPK